MRRTADPFAAVKREIIRKFEQALDSASNLTPQQASRLSGIPLEELEQQIPPVLLNEWTVVVRGKTVTRRRLRYPLSRVLEFNQRRTTA